MRDLRKVIVGFLTGITDAVPGVSGATVLLLFGIYEDTIKKASTVLYGTTGDFLRNAIKGELTISNTDSIRHLLLLSTGIFFGALGMTLLVDRLLKTNPSPIFGFFAGIILGSGIVILYRDVGSKVSDYSIQKSVLILVGVIISILISIVSIGLGNSIPVLIFSGAIATFGMVLPGVSGSFILLVIGQYEYSIGLISKLIGRTISKSETVSLASLIAGGIIGIIINISIISSQIDKNRDYIIALMGGLVIGGISAPIREIYSLDSPEFFLSSISFIIGVLIVIIASLWVNSNN